MPYKVFWWKKIEFGYIKYELGGVNFCVCLRGKVDLFWIQRGVGFFFDLLTNFPDLPFASFKQPLYENFNIILCLLSSTIPYQWEDFQGLFEEDSEEDEHQVALNTMGDTCIFGWKIYQSWEGFHTHGILLVCII